jgi:hypothetical protein
MRVTLTHVAAQVTKDLWVFNQSVGPAARAVDHRMGAVHIHLNEAYVDDSDKSLPNYTLMRRSSCELP